MTEFKVGDKVRVDRDHYLSTSSQGPNEWEVTDYDERNGFTEITNSSSGKINRVYSRNLYLLPPMPPADSTDRIGEYNMTIDDEELIATHDGSTHYFYLDQDQVDTLDKEIKFHTKVRDYIEEHLELDNPRAKKLYLLSSPATQDKSWDQLTPAVRRLWINRLKDIDET